MAIKTPNEYIESIRDERVVYYAGERVEDVTTNPFLRICIDWMAMDYVLSNDSRYRSLLVDKDEDGEDVPFILSAQRSREDHTHQPDRQVL